MENELHTTTAAPFGPSCLPGWLRELYPFTPRTFITPGGARMSYVDECASHEHPTPNKSGAGVPPASVPPTLDLGCSTFDVGRSSVRSTEAVLLLHGNPTWSFYYRELIPALVARGHRCIAPDHIGMGLSEKPSANHYSYMLPIRINDIAALVRSLGLTRIHLVVHDWGGAIGLGLATLHPELAGRIVILNTAAFHLPRIPRRIALCKTGFPGTLLVRGLNAFAGPATWMSMHRRHLTPDEKRGFLFPYDSWANRVAVDAFVKDIPLTPVHPTWRTLETTAAGLERFAVVDPDRKPEHPALILWGGRDFCFNDTFYDEWRRRWPHAQAHRIADAGHYVLADAAEEVIPRIADFLTP
ncbi:alpha/beta fold hydrolase [Opitutaceae bacterium TAV4]|nr:alpha/beta fold hydrolase [Opitutaceae bacterium TAV4]RRK00566.1 alpha/beta fold hydrolase [Opitutaceae bacterium TAV3]